jgi:DNA-binding protein YbaB
MAFDPLPSPASFVSAVLDIEHRMAALEAQLRGLSFTAGAAPNLIVKANGMVEVAAVTIPPTAINTIPATGQPDLVDLASRLLTLANQAFTAANTAAAAQCATTTGGFNLLNLCVPNGPFPNFAGFQDTANALIAEEPAIAAQVAAMRFTGQAGSVTAVVTGTLSVASLTIGSLPGHLAVLEQDVADAINRARRAGDVGIDKGIQNPSTNPPKVTLAGLCLHAHGNLSIGNNVRIVGTTPNTFAAVANTNGSGVTTLGTDIQIGDIWSRAPVTFADRTVVNGSIRSNLSITPATSPGPGNQTVTGQIVANSVIVVPALDFTVTFPGTNQGPINLDPGHPPTTQAINPGAWSDITVKTGCTLQLKTGTYTFTSLDLESGGTLSLDSKNGQVLIHIKGSLIWRGAVTERTGTTPKLFMSCFATNPPASPISMEAPFRGTFVAPNASVDFKTVAAPGYTGAFFAKDISVQPNQTITFIPITGTPPLGSL